MKLGNNRLGALAAVGVATLAGIYYGSREEISGFKTLSIPKPDPTVKKEPSRNRIGNKPNAEDLLDKAFGTKIKLSPDIEASVNGQIARGKDPEAVKVVAENFERLRILGLIPANVLEKYQRNNLLGQFNLESSSYYERAFDAYQKIQEAMSNNILSRDDVNLILKNEKIKSLLLTPDESCLDGVINFSNLGLSAQAKKWLNDIQTTAIKKLTQSMMNEANELGLKIDFPVPSPDAGIEDIQKFASHLNTQNETFTQYNAMAVSLGLNSDELNETYRNSSSEERINLAINALHGIALDQTIRTSINKQIEEGKIVLSQENAQKLGAMISFDGFYAIPESYNPHMNTGVYSTGKSFKDLLNILPEIIPMERITKDLAPEQRQLLSNYLEIFSAN